MKWEMSWRLAKAKLAADAMARGTPPLRALYGDCGELSVHQLDAVLRDGPEEALDIVLADLVPEAPRTGVDQDRDPPSRRPNASAASSS